ncbi:T9SS type A sorting domain-containing protein [bacterium]|nr:T9SS type A sorting domain-containing protein [bacterium]
MGIIYECIGWLGEGCVPPFGFTNICSLACDDYGTLEWLWDTVATGIDEESIFPENISISAYQHPFNSSVTILLAAGGVGASDARSGQVGIEIFDISGRLVADLPVTNCGIPQFVPTPVIWQPEKSVGSGIYLIRAKIGDGEITKRIVYLK